MNHIDLQYINASQLARSLANCKDLADLKEVIFAQIQEDLSRAQHYLDKYDRPSERIEVNLDNLKSELDSVKAILEKLK